MAEQRESVQRRVALNQLRNGIEGEPLLRRFEAERRALASMDHDAIARVYDAGLDEDGRPWFAMGTLVARR